MGVALSFMFRILSSKNSSLTGFQKPQEFSVSENRPSHPTDVSVLSNEDRKKTYEKKTEGGLRAQPTRTERVCGKDRSGGTRGQANETFAAGEDQSPEGADTGVTSRPQEGLIWACSEQAQEETDPFLGRNGIQKRQNLVINLLSQKVSYNSSSPVILQPLISEPERVPRGAPGVLRG